MTTTVSHIEEVVKTVLFRNMELSNRISSFEAEKASIEAEKALPDAENKRTSSAIISFGKS